MMWPFKKSDTRIRVRVFRCTAGISPYVVAWYDAKDRCRQSAFCQTHDAAMEIVKLGPNANSAQSEILKDEVLYDSGLVDSLPLDTTA